MWREKELCWRVWILEPRRQSGNHAPPLTSHVTSGNWCHYLVSFYSSVKWAWSLYPPQGLRGRGFKHSHVCPDCGAQGVDKWRVWLFWGREKSLRVSCGLGGGTAGILSQISCFSPHFYIYITSGILLTEERQNLLEALEELQHYGRWDCRKDFPTEVATKEGEGYRLAVGLSEVGRHGESQGPFFAEVGILHDHGILWPPSLSPLGGAGSWSGTLGVVCPHDCPMECSWCPQGPWCWPGRSSGGWRWRIGIIQCEQCLHQDKCTCLWAQRITNEGMGQVHILWPVTFQSPDICVHCNRFAWHWPLICNSEWSFRGFSNPDDQEANFRVSVPCTIFLDSVCSFY